MDVGVVLLFPDLRVPGGWNVSNMRRAYSLSVSLINDMLPGFSVLANLLLATGIALHSVVLISSVVTRVKSTHLTHPKAFWSQSQKSSIPFCADIAYLSGISLVSLYSLED